MFHAIRAGEEFNSWDFNFNLLFNEISLNNHFIQLLYAVVLFKFVANMNSQDYLFISVSL